MAATYTEISKEEFEKFLNRVYRGFRPKMGQEHSEYYYDIMLDDNVSVRVYSSIKSHGSSASVGQDAIRVVLYSTKTNRPLNKKAGSAIVKRTQNWRNALMDRVYSFIGEYHEKKDFYDRIADGDKDENKDKKNVVYYADGNTYKVKDDLKAMGFRWDNDRKQWFIKKEVDLSHLPNITLKQRSASIHDLAMEILGMHNEENS